MREIIKFFKCINENEELKNEIERKEKLFGLGSEQTKENYKIFLENEIIPIAKKHGFSFTADDYIKFINDNSTKVLNEDELEEVAGGKGKVVLPITMAAISFFQGPLSQVSTYAMQPSSINSEASMLRQRKAELDENIRKEELRIKIEDYNRFIENFKKDIYDKDTLPKEYSEFYLGSPGADYCHMSIKSMIENCNCDQNRKDELIKIYANLTWFHNLSRDIYFGVRENHKGEFFYRSPLVLSHDSLEKIMTSFVSFSDERNQINEKTYDAILKMLDPPGTPLDEALGFFGTSYGTNPNSVSIMQTLFMLTDRVRKLSTSNSRPKYEEARGFLTMSDHKLENLPQEKEYEPMRVIADAVRKIILNPIRAKVENDLVNFESIKKPKERKLTNFNDMFLWREDRKVSKGGFGSVYTCIDKKGEKVAIKLLRGTSFDESKIEKLTKINGPYIMKMHGLTQSSDGKQGLVMEYVHGPTNISDALINTERFSKKDIIRICKQLVDAFETFAKAGFLHTDLDQHTQNVVIDKEGNLKIIDYDTARDAGVNETTTRSNIKDALTYIAIAMSVSYPDLCQQFFNKYPYLTFDYTGDLYNLPVRNVELTENAPTTFEAIKNALNELEDEANQ